MKYKRTFFIWEYLLAIIVALLISSCGGGGASDTNAGDTVIKSEDILIRSDDIRPNIIIVYTDDQGFTDLGSNKVASDIHTPNLDRVAAEGVLMSSGYVTAPQCSPSRASLLTGRYQQRFGLDDNTQGPLPLEEETLASMVKKEGYVTGMVGKWHLDPNSQTQSFLEENTPVGEEFLPIEIKYRYFPNNRGFDKIFFGNSERYLVNFNLDGSPFGSQPKYIEDKRGRIEVKTDAALAFIEAHLDVPFFLYLSYFSPHTPLQASEESLNKFPGVMDERRRHALAMISEIDKGVGLLVEKLEVEGLADNTLFFFISDNGAPIWDMDEDKGVEDTIWNGSLNTPFKGEKGTILEGGIRVPFLIKWPAVLQANQIIEQPVSTLDVVPTVLSAVNAPRNDNIDGVDLIPMLNQEISWTERPLYWRFYGQSAVRRGEWKYLHLSDGREFLFNLQDDPGETLNLAEINPSITTSLRSELEDWAGNLLNPGVPKSTPLMPAEVLFFERYLQ